MTIRVGSRDSALAVIQARLVMDALARSLPGCVLELVTMKTAGDLRSAASGGLRQQAAFDGGAGKALFTAALEEALSEGRVDLCVHSLKDMSADGSEDFPIVATPERGDCRDALVLPAGAVALPAGAVVLPAGTVFEGLTAVRQPVGCSSLRRKAQLEQLVPGVRVEPVRGNVPTRLARLDGGDYGALVLAAAGLERLSLIERAAYCFPVDLVTPAAGQGTLAVQGRRGEDYGFLAAIHDADTALASQAERQVVRALGADCGSPVGVYAEVNRSEARLTGFYAPPLLDGSGAGYGPPRRARLSGPRERALFLADSLAASLAAER